MEVEHQTGGRHRFSEISTPSAPRTIIVLLAGVGIGIGLAVLFAPRSGPEVREAIIGGYRKTLAALTGRAQDLREHAQHLGGGLRENVPNLLRFRRRTSPPS